MADIQFPNQKQLVGSKTCGPSCLRNIYQSFQLNLTLEDIQKELDVSDENTWLPQLARHVHAKGIQSKIISSCSHTVAPDWKNLDTAAIIEKLKTWITKNHEHNWMKDALYLLFYLQEGGGLEIVDLTVKILDRELDQNKILLCCIEESWLWGKRKIKGKAEYDDVKGATGGHFVVVYGKEGDDYLVSDPYPTNLENREGLYSVNKDKLLVSILIWNPEVLAITKQ